MARTITIYQAMAPDGGNHIHVYGKSKGAAAGRLINDYGFESLKGVEFSAIEIELSRDGVAQALQDAIDQFCVNEH
jgi:hypothetical protein